jgi:hypothetical protein
MNPNNFENITNSFYVSIRTIRDATMDGNLTEFKYLMVEKGLCAKMRNKWDALCDAAKYGHVTIVIYLIEEQKVNIQSNDISEPIKLSIGNGHLNILEYFMKLDIHINYSDLLILAIENNRLNIIEFLLGQHIDISVIVMDYALFMAMKCGHIDIVKCLLEHGANIHVENDYILRSSAENGCLDDVKYFIGQGADVNAIQYLASSTKEIHSDIVEYLNGLVIV